MGAEEGWLVDASNDDVYFRPPSFCVFCYFTQKYTNFERFHLSQVTALSQETPTARVCV